MNEFNIIERYFADASYVRKDVVLGIGDDAAITQVPANQNLVTTTDTLVDGIHFLPNSTAAHIAHKAIAVNLSDLAAMGAEPSWISISLSLPEANHEWLKAFSEKVAELTEYYSIQLIGGDTVKGPLAITITAQGFVPQDSALTRTGAQNGDLIFVTGTLGDAGAGLDILKDKLHIGDVEARDYLVNRHRFPVPRVIAGTMLRRRASACIDISDGLLQDVMHIANGSGTGVLLHLDRLPLSKELGNNVEKLEHALQYATVAGDDYEILFTIPEEQRTSIETSLDSYAIPYTCIGQMTGANGKLDLRLNDQEYPFENLEEFGYSHF